MEEKIWELEMKIDELKSIIIETLESREEYMTPKEAAIYFGCTQNHIYHLIRKGDIKVVESLGTLKRIPMSQFRFENQNSVFGM